MSAGAERETERFLVEAARALEAADPVAASGAIERVLELLATGPALSDPELLVFAHARLLAYADGEAARLESELECLERARRHVGAGAARRYAPSSVRSRATA